MDKKIRLLLVIRHPVGGIRTYLKYTYKYLNPENFELTILTVRNPEVTHIHSDLKPFNPKLIEVENNRPEMNLIRAVYNLLASNNFDFIHSQGFTAGILTVIINYYFKIPHVITPHQVLQENHFGPSILGHLKKRLYGKLLSGADIIQSVSFDAESNLVKLFPSLVKKSNLKVILNGIDLVTFSPESSRLDCSLREKLGIRPDTFVFGFLGRFMPEKGFEYLIEAVETLSRDQFHSEKMKILAVNDGAFIREYRAAISKKNLMDYFIFIGFTPDVKKILTGINALVIPSVSEACPLLPMESFVSGCPVIASDCIGLREVVKGTPAVIVKSKDSNSLADGLKLFMNNSKKIEQETVRFIPIAREKFDSKRTAAQLESLFVSIFTNRRNHARRESI